MEGKTDTVTPASFRRVVLCAASVAQEAKAKTSPPASSLPIIHDTGLNNNSIVRFGKQIKKFKSWTKKTIRNRLASTIMDNFA